MHTFNDSNAVNWQNPCQRADVCIKSINKVTGNCVIAYSVAASKLSYHAYRT